MILSFDPERDAIYNEDGEVVAYLAWSHRLADGHKPDTTAVREEIRRALIYHSAHRDDADDAFAREEHE